MPLRRVLLVRLLVFALIVVGLYGLLRLKRSELVDFAVPRTAAYRFLAHEPLYRPEDGHYQYKYFPTFALAMTPFTLLSKEAAEFIWFTLTVAMAWALTSLSIARLPDRRSSARLLFWLLLFLNGKSLIKELAFGQFNLPFALLMLGAVTMAQRGNALAAGALVGAGVFVKPYALILVPWLAWRLGARSLVSFGVLLAAGLALPAAFYGWHGNLTLLHEWYRTVTDTTGPNLMGHENMSFMSMWAKWLQPGSTAGTLAIVSTVVTVAAGIAMMARWRVAEPHYLDVAYFLILIPLVSPQGWDYVLLIAMPAFACLVDRWHEVSLPWRGIFFAGIFLSSFMIFDLLRRPLYVFLMEHAAVSVGALLMALSLIHLRARAIA